MQNYKQTFYFLITSDFLSDNKNLFKLLSTDLWKLNVYSFLILSEKIIVTRSISEEKKDKNKDKFFFYSNSSFRGAHLSVAKTYSVKINITFYYVTQI